MDITKVTSEQLQNMSDEEKREYANEFIQAVKKNPSIKATFFDPEKKQTITLTELINKLGEEKAADFLYNTLTTSTGKKVALTAQEHSALIKKWKDGTITDEEKRLLQMANSALHNTDGMQFQKNGTGVLVGLTEFAQNAPKVFPTISDVISVSNILSLATLSIATSEDINEQRKAFNDLRVTGDKIGDDILNAWKSSLTSEVPTELLIAGLCQALVKTAKAANIKLPESDILFDYLNLDKNAYHMHIGK